MQAGNKRNLNIVHSEHACSPTSFTSLSNQGHIWILDHAMGDKGTLGGKIPAPELKLLAGKTPKANDVKSASTFLISKARAKEKLTRRR